MPRTLTGGDAPAPKPKKTIKKGAVSTKKAVRTKAPKKEKKKKSKFLGVTAAEKAASMGVSLERYNARVAINKFRVNAVNQFMKEKATGEKDSKKRQGRMKEGWSHANKLAAERYGAQLKKNGIDPRTFKFI